MKFRGVAPGRERKGVHTQIYKLLKQKRWIRESRSGISDGKVVTVASEVR